MLAGVAERCPYSQEENWEGRLYGAGGSSVCFPLSSVDHIRHGLSVNGHRGSPFSHGHNRVFFACPAPANPIPRDRAGCAGAVDGAASFPPATRNANDAPVGRMLPVADHRGQIIVGLFERRPVVVTFGRRVERQAAFAPVSHGGARFVACAAGSARVRASRLASTTPGHATSAPRNQSPDQPYPTWL